MKHWANGKLSGQQASSGQAMIEFTLIFPLLFLLIVNTINFGAFIFDWITVANAARAGAEYWALGTAANGTPAQPTTSQVSTLVISDVSSLFNRASVVVRMCRNNNGVVSCTGNGSGTPSADPEPATYISTSVDVTYTYNPPIPLFTFHNLGISATIPSTTIHRQATMRLLQ